MNIYNACGLIYDSDGNEVAVNENIADYTFIATKTETFYAYTEQN